METIIERMRGKLEKFCKDLRELYSENLVSIILYGSFSKGNFIPKRSDINLLVVLKKMEFEDLSRAINIFNRWSKVGRTTPLLFTEEYINRSIDVFPIEFSDIKENYEILYGKDVLKDIRIEQKNLRYVCEKELKEKLLRLRQAYLEAGVRPFILKRVMINSFSSVTAVLRNVLKLIGETPSYDIEELLTALSGKCHCGFVQLQKGNRILQS
ncbi:MAG: nucleotidyltransferase domain-containing protein [Candidatus Omnitrophota bacterium]